MSLQATAEKRIESEVIHVDEPHHGLDGLHDIFTDLDYVMYGEPSRTRDDIDHWDEDVYTTCVQFRNWVRARDWLATAEQNRESAIGQVQKRTDSDYEDDIPAVVNFLIDNYRDWDDYVVDNKLTLKFVG